MNIKEALEKGINILKEKNIRRGIIKNKDNT